MRRDKLKAAQPRAEPAPSGRYVLDEQVGFLMRVATQRHTAIFSASMIEALTQTQFAALAKLYEVGHCSQNQLGRLICLDAATIKGVVDRLSAHGFVTALGDPKDRRRRAVALTERCRAVTQEAMLVAAEITSETLAPLTVDERELVVKLLRKMG